MTIAAGFTYKDGVLLCADTEVTGWAISTHDAKILYFERGDINVGMAYAGNSAFAKTAIQACFRRLTNAPKEEFLNEIETVLDEQYRKNVFENPNQATDSSLAYSLLISIASGGASALYEAHQNTVHENTGYSCIGIGESLAHFLIRSSFDTGLDERQILSIASLTIGAVKESIPGCGGASQFLLLRNDGTVRVFQSLVNEGHAPATSIDWVERFYGPYNRFARNLFFRMADPATTDEEFEKALSEFVEKIRELRNKDPKGPFRQLMDVMVGG